MLERLKKLATEAAMECFEGGDVREIFLKYMQRAVAPELIKNELTKKIGEQQAEIVELKSKIHNQDAIDNEIIKAIAENRDPISWLEQHQKLEKIEKILASDSTDTLVLAKIITLMKEKL